MIEYAAKTPKFPVRLHQLLNVGALTGERWDRAQPMLDYFATFEESFNRFPGFNDEVQGVYQEQVDGRIKFYTYVVQE